MNGVFNIVCAQDGLVLDAFAPDAGNNGCPLMLFQAHNGQNQHWKIADHGGGSHSIQCLASSLILDANMPDVSTDGCRVQLYTNLNAPNQRWTFEDYGNGTHKIKCQAGGLVLDAVSSDTAMNGCRVQLWGATGANNQAWRLESVPQQTTRLSAVVSRMMIPGIPETKVVFEGLYSHIEHREKYKELVLNVNVAVSDVPEWLALFACITASSALTIALGTLLFGPLAWLTIAQVIISCTALCFSIISPETFKQADGEAEVVARWGNWHRV
jgi:hypothetical protein